MSKATLSVPLLAALCLSALAQGPPSLEAFTSPDGNFQFVYPESYELLVGERLLKATQGRQSALPVCDFSTAVACVLYPIESARETKLEAAGFSVDTVASAENEPDCLAYKDEGARARTLDLSQTSISIRSRSFRHASTTKKVPGHFQTADFYRTFSQKKCYELQIEVSLSDDSAHRDAKSSSSLGDATANTARESLKLILSSIVFEKE